MVHVTVLLEHRTTLALKCYTIVDNAITPQYLAPCRGWGWMLCRRDFFGELLTTQNYFIAFHLLQKNSNILHIEVLHLLRDNSGRTFIILEIFFLAPNFRITLLLHKDVCGMWLAGCEEVGWWLVVELLKVKSIT